MFKDVMFIKKHENLAGRLRTLDVGVGDHRRLDEPIADRPAFETPNGLLKPLMKLSSRTILHPIFLLVLTNYLQKFLDLQSASCPECMSSGIGSRTAEKHLLNISVPQISI
jgi:hypothetical protein